MHASKHCAIGLDWLHFLLTQKKFSGHLPEPPLLLLPYCCYRAHPPTAAACLAVRIIETICSSSHQTVTQARGEV